MLTRRSLTKSTLALPLVYAGWRGLAAARAYAWSVDDDDCGVTSGHPTPDSVMLWTRVPGQSAGDARELEVTYEVASDAAFAPETIVARGVATTSAAADFTVKPTVGGLEPYTSYYYRFRTDDWTSVTGRTKTAPAPGMDLARLKLGVVSCQKFSAGYYTAYLHLASEDVDFCVHLGDHIYEEEGARDGVPDPIGGQAARTLADYRAKYRHYLSDPAWREARRQFCWIDLWDDHEVGNDYAGDRDRIADPERTTAAYQAFFEYMPVPGRVVLDERGAPTAQVYRTHQLGSLAELFVLDQRQYRKPNPCSGTFVAKGCDELNSPDQVMLGAPQEPWLKERLGASQSRWKLLLSELQMMPMKLPGSRFVNLDAWDAYPVERRDLLGFIEANGIMDVVVLSGDIHAAVQGHLYSDPGQHAGPAAAVEITTTSISSPTLADHIGGLLGGGARAIIMTSNRHIGWADIERHGYTILELTPEQMTVRHLAVDTIERPQSGIREVRRAYVATGSGRIQT